MIYCVVLAAGESTRFPLNKLLYLYYNRPVVVQTISNIIESGAIDEVIVVTGYQHEILSKIIADSGMRVHIVYNKDYRNGMSSSVKVGIKYMLERLKLPDGIMINPGDVAWVHPGVYALVVTRFLEGLHAHPIAVATYRGRKGHPIIFSSHILGDLLLITEERFGLKEVINKYRDSILAVETGYPGVLLDLDDVLDLLEIKRSIYK